MDCSPRGREKGELGSYLGAQSYWAPSEPEARGREEKEETWGWRESARLLQERINLKERSGGTWRPKKTRGGYLLRKGDLALSGANGGPPLSNRREKDKGKGTLDGQKQELARSNQDEEGITMLRQGALQLDKSRTKKGGGGKEREKETWARTGKVLKNSGRQQSRWGAKTAWKN